MWNFDSLSQTLLSISRKAIELMSESATPQVAFEADTPNDAVIEVMRMAELSGQLGVSV